MEMEQNKGGIPYHTGHVGNIDLHRDPDLLTAFLQG